MAKKPENQFIANVHKHITGVYCEKMFNPYRGGTPDVWYSGMGGDLWIEYKYIIRSVLPARIKPNLSAQQVHWIRNRIQEGRKVWVATGIRVEKPRRKTYVHTYHGIPSLEQCHSIDERRLRTPKQLAELIMETCGENSDCDTDPRFDTSETRSVLSDEGSKDS